MRSQYSIAVIIIIIVSSIKKKRLYQFFQAFHMACMFLWRNYSPKIVHGFCGGKVQPLTCWWSMNGYTKLRMHISCSTTKSSFVMMHYLFPNTITIKVVSLVQDLTIYHDEDNMRALSISPTISLIGSSRDCQTCKVRAKHPQQNSHDWKKIRGGINKRRNNWSHHYSTYLNSICT